MQRVPLPVQRADDAADPPPSTQFAAMDLDMDLDEDGSSDAMNVDTPATAAAPVATMASKGKEKFAVYKAKLTERMKKLTRKFDRSVLKGHVLGGIRKRGQERTRATTLDRLPEAAIRAMYHDPSTAEYEAVPGDEDEVQAGVEVIGNKLGQIAEANLAAAGGSLFQSGAVDKVPKKQTAFVSSYTGTPRQRNASALPLPGKPHFRPIQVPSRPTTPDAVTTPNGTTLSAVGMYAYEEGDEDHRVHTFVADPEARQPELPVVDQSTLPNRSAQLGSGLTKHAGTTKTAGPVNLDIQRLDKWSGVRKGYTPSQKTAMCNVSAREAAMSSGYGDKTANWQWLHLIAFTLGGRDNSEPNEEGNLVAGLDAANGFHLVLETFVKMMVRDRAVSGVSLTATAQMIPDSFHVCKSIKYRVSWTKNGRSRTVDFRVSALDPNKVLGSHTELLCKRFDIDYAKSDEDEEAENQEMGTQEEDEQPIAGSSTA
ncbi:hypothetical protein ACMA1D_14035 [Streptomyces sp. 796.1]|uniref:hypothetical protein n=1 Tax=Streptomyces sp. 796.1 TaxID=3163029 RepID=UPI0039C8EBFB